MITITYPWSNICPALAHYLCCLMISIVGFVMTFCAEKEPDTDIYLKSFKREDVVIFYWWLGTKSNSQCFSDQSACPGNMHLKLLFHTLRWDRLIGKSLWDLETNLRFYLIPYDLHFVRNVSDVIHLQLYDTYMRKGNKSKPRESNQFLNGDAYDIDQLIPNAV